MFKESLQEKKKNNNTVSVSSINMKPVTNAK